MPTVVTGTLVDSLGQKWANAPVQFIFFPTPGNPGPFSINGVEFDKMPPPLLTDANGFFTTTLPSNSEITPSNSQWQMIVGPNSSYPAIVLNIYLPFGSVDVSSFFTNAGAINQVQSLMIPRAYADGEVIVPPNVGQLYYNVIEKQLKYWESGNWVPIGGGVTPVMVYPPPGIGVSTGNSWAASIDPAIVAYVDRTNSFSTDQIIHGSLSADILNTGIVNLYDSGVLKLRILNRPSPLVVGGPTISSDGAGVVINAAPGNNIHLNWDQGSGTYFGNGAAGAAGYVDTIGNATFNGALAANSGNFNTNLNTGSFQINGTAPAGLVLMGNGTNYVPSPIPAPPTPHLVVTTFDVTPSRSFGTVYQNTTNGFRIVSGTGRTNGGTVGSTEGLIGSSTPNIRAWGQTSGATISQGVIGFNFTVPPGWFYQVLANSLSQGPGGGNAVFAVGSWIEEQVTIA